MLQISVEPSGKAGRMVGKFNAESFAAVRDMPGRKKWDGHDLLFELTRANIEFINARIEAKWNSGHINEMLSLLEKEAEQRKQMNAPVKLPPEALKFAYKTTPKDWQAESFHMFKDAPYFGLFFEQGLGKTKADLDITAYKWSKGEIDTLFVLAPNNVHVQWVKEQIPIHLPDFVPYKAVYWRAEQTKKKLNAIEEMFAYKDGLRVFTMGQESLITPNGLAMVKRLLSSCKVHWTIDESPSIKTPSAARTKAVLKLKNLAVVRSILSGTPVGKGVEDLYTQLSFLSERILGFNSYYTFRNHFCEERQILGAPAGVKEIVGYKNLDELKDRMNAYCMRRTARDCLNLDLPDRVTYPVELTPEQKRIYISLAEESIVQIQSGEIITAEQAAVKIMRLQQVVGGFAKDEEGVIHRIPTNRPRAAMNFFLESNTKLIIWARFHEDIDMLSEEFKAFPHIKWDGRTSADERMKNKARFINDDECMVMIANQAAAGTGTDGLQYACHRMLYYSNNFKATDRWQSESRLVRMGQEAQVLIGDLNARGTVDTKIRATILKREQQAFTLLDFDRLKEQDERNGVQSFSMSDFVNFLQPDFEE